MKKEIKIYQLKEGHTRDYGFMNYDWAEAHGFKMSDYEVNAEFNYEIDEDDYSLLEKLFFIGNDMKLREFFKTRSLSVSDIVEINDKKYYCEMVGWKEI